jgi:hypothetical protein
MQFFKHLILLMAKLFKGRTEMPCPGKSKKSKKSKKKSSGGKKKK